MNHITLREVDESNFLACPFLKLGAQQKRFVSRPIQSLAQAYVYYSQRTPFAICHTGQVVGYLTVIYDYDEETYFIWHLMIDARHRDRGCERTAMEVALAYICSRPSGASNLVRLAVSPENAAACHLYQTLCFSPIGRVDRDEVELGRVFD